MKFLFASLFLLISLSISAAYIENVAITLKQPNGAVIHCYITGDEFHHRLHDSLNYTIVKNNVGYYVYAKLEKDNLIPTEHIVGEANPLKLNLQKGIDVPDYKIIAKRNAFYSNMTKLSHSKGVKTLKSLNQINNIVIFIRFSDEQEFTESIQYYDSSFNSTLPNANSMKAYYWEVSYQQLELNSYLYPLSTGTVLSYQDANPRAYYQPYDAVSNPDGYADDNERVYREHSLLANAVNAVNSQIPSNLNVDMNGDGYVDNVCFIVKGDVDGWAELLWPHRWVLYNQNAFINGKQVWDYNLQIESFFYIPTRGVGVLNHEMFHTLGAPDLYHYNTDYRNFRSVGYWDLMDRSMNPSESMLMYMKYFYAGWIDDIPEITTPGIYTLHPSTAPVNNCYRIASSNPNEYFVLEYRKRVGIFENSIKSEGLLIYRINMTNVGGGNSSYPDVPDEIYVYRPYGIDTINGLIDSAAFSSNSGRVLFNNSSEPWCFLSDNITDGGISISQISDLDTTISFCFQCPNAIEQHMLESRNIVYPNPAINYINSVFEDERNVKYELYDISGRLISGGMLKSNEPIDVSTLQPTVYRIVFKKDSWVKYGTFIKQ